MHHRPLKMPGAGSTSDLGSKQAANIGAFGGAAIPGAGLVAGRALSRVGPAPGQPARTRPPEPGYRAAACRQENHASRGPEVPAQWFRAGWLVTIPMPAAWLSKRRAGARPNRAPAPAGRHAA